MSRSKPNTLPSVDDLRRIFEYDAKTGLLMWKTDRTSGMGGVIAKAGDEAGCAHHGYRLISIGSRTNRQFFHAHRIAWKLFYGEDPPNQIDHIDRNRSNNAIANLRAASQSENAANRSIAKDNKSGCPGVMWDARRKKWKVSVNKMHLGYFTDYQAAVAVRKKAAAAVFGEFSPHSTIVT